MIAHEPDCAICAYLPAGEPYPVLQIKVGEWRSPVIRRDDIGYSDVLYFAKQLDVRWLFGQTPQPLEGTETCLGVIATG